MVFNARDSFLGARQHKMHYRHLLSTYCIPGIIGGFFLNCSLLIVSQPCEVTYFYFVYEEGILIPGCRAGLALDLDQGSVSLAPCLEAVFYLLSH